MKKFKRPFRIMEPFDVRGADGRRVRQRWWLVVDYYCRTISTHKTEAGAERGLKAACENVPNED